MFAPELPGLDRDEIRRWYNGYNWTGETVYNPFDVLLLFQKRQFRPWWFETATPTFLVELLLARRTFVPQLEHPLASEQLLSTFDVDYQVYLFEFKVVELTPEGCALQQLKDRNYAEKYRALNQPIHLIGVEFSREQRSVVGFEAVRRAVETL